LPLKVFLQLGNLALEMVPYGEKDEKNMIKKKERN
jgi:hypothetical protein